MVELFQLGDFTLASGARSRWKIECDAITLGQWEALAVMAVERLPQFGTVYGVPRGGLPFANALRVHATPGCEVALIAEDVVTTGGSIERYVWSMKDDPQIVFPARYVGVCVFARGECPRWITPLFSMPPIRKWE